MTNSDNSTPFAAQDYDVSVRQTIPFYENIFTEVVDVVKTVQPDAKCWLDTGCGTGYLVEVAMPFFPQTHFVLTDTSEQMLKQAMNRLRNASSRRLSFLPLTSNENLLVYQNEIHPQVITAILVHHYLGRQLRYQAIEACYRLLDNGGVFITVENIVPFTQRGTQFGLDRWQRFQVRHGRASSIVEEHIKRFNTRYFPITVNEHFELLRKTGFRAIELFWFSYLQAGFYAVK